MPFSTWTFGKGEGNMGKPFTFVKGQEFKCCTRQLESEMALGLVALELEQNREGTLLTHRNNLVKVT